MASVSLYRYADNDPESNQPASVKVFLLSYCKIARFFRYVLVSHQSWFRKNAARIASNLFKLYFNPLKRVCSCVYSDVLLQVFNFLN